MTPTKNLNSVQALFFAFIFFAVASNANAAGAGSLYDLPGRFTAAGSEGAVEFTKWKGTPLVVTMTYTSCQSACPRILERMKNVQKFFNSKNRRAKFVIATFDPKRDTTTKLGTHQNAVGEIAKDWVFLTGSDADLRKLSMVLGIRYEKNPESGNISHDNKILITNDKGEIAQELNGLSPDVSELQ